MGGRSQQTLHIRSLIQEVLQPLLPYLLGLKLDKIEVDNPGDTIKKKMHIQRVSFTVKNCGNKSHRG